MSIYNSIKMFRFVGIIWWLLLTSGSAYMWIRVGVSASNNHLGEAYVMALLAGIYATLTASFLSNHLMAVARYNEAIRSFSREGSTVAMVVRFADGSQSFASDTVKSSIASLGIKVSSLPPKVEELIRQRNWAELNIAQTEAGHPLNLSYIFRVVLSGYNKGILEIIGVSSGHRIIASTVFTDGKVCPALTKILIDLETSSLR